MENPDERVGNIIPIQGRLTDPAGNPLNGDFQISFRLYLDDTGGTAVCYDLNEVTVTNGLFTSEILGNCPAEINGQQLYLSIEVETDGEMSPRQPIYATPYAWSLRPGAVISASIGAEPLLHLETWSSNGRGLRSYAMSQTGVNYGIVGASRSPDGFGGYFYNNGGGVGLFSSTNSFTNFGFIGMQADYYSKDDYTDFYQSGGLFGGVNGVIGISHETVRVGAGVYGLARLPQAQATVCVVLGFCHQRLWIFGHATAATGNTRGVYGISDLTAGRGVFGYASATIGDTYGVYGDSNSSDGRGVYGVADNAGGGVGSMGRAMWEVHYTN